MIDEYISQFMNRRVLSGDAETTLKEVVRRMHAEVQSAFLVCEDRVPVGVITERDIVVVLSKVLEGEDHLDAQARDIMASPVHTLPETAAMSEVLRVMKQRGFRRVPITDNDNRLSGIVNLTELQNAMNASLERRGQDLEAAVTARTAELKAANAKLEQLTLLDGLTGLLNRRAMLQRMEEQHALCRRYGNLYSIILLDIDHFKLYNDTQGHLAGDEVIRTVAQTLRAAVRGADSVYRYGGEEFLVLLPETDVAGARILADRIRAAVAAAAIPHSASPTADHLTASLGLTGVMNLEAARLSTWENIVERADRALYKAKQGGRNRCVCWAEGD